ncbi:MAG: SGNH/GDSL hydrolase family protein, partial [Okeania sp. SIO3H1]|nr:SGNH/GDSL hydrolase family protein [Okeania sp. SIO3H1]
SNLNNAKFILAMTPLLREVSEPGPRDYEIKTRKRLEEFTQAENILYLDLLPIFKSVSEPDSLYRDHIHLSPEGNLVISELISKSIIEQN